MSNNPKYKSYLSCLGGICGCCCCTYRSIQTSTIGLLEQYGQYIKPLEPGLHYYNPFTQSIKSVQLKTQVIDLPYQIVFTKDNIGVDINTSVFFRIIDAYLSTYFVEDVQRSIIEMVYVVMRKICGGYTLQQLLLRREEINTRITQQTQAASREWGVYVEKIVLKDMILKRYVERSLSIIPKTKRDIEAQIISAEADLGSAKLYREASDILDMDAAIQIRFLDTLQIMNTFNSQKYTIIPMKPKYQV